MALTAGTGGGDYLEPEQWISLGKENALVAVVVKGIGTVHMEKGPSAGKEVDEARFDLYVLDGSRRGEVHLGQSTISRGLVAPLKRTANGDEVAYRAGVGQAYGRDYPQLNAPGDLPQAAIDLFEELKASGAKVSDAGKEKATAGAGASSSKGGGRDFADTPEF